MDYIHHTEPLFVFLPCLVVFLVCAAGFALVGLWLWALIDCATNEPSTGSDKVIWTLIIIFLHAIGAILYLVVRRPKRIKEIGR